MHGDVEDAYPVASLQLGMLYEMLREPDVLPYHQVAGLRLDDTLPFAAGALEAAAGALAARHEILRTSFDLGAAPEARQVVHPRVALRSEVTDLTGLPADEQERALRAAVAAEARRPLDAAKAPLLRLHAFRLTATTAHLLVPHAHAVLDGWSLMIALSELVRDYRLLRRGEPPGGAPPQVRYRRFVELERAALRSAAVRGFWHDRLDRVAPASLPAPSPDARPGPMRRLRVPFADLAPALRKLAADARVPLKSVLLAAHLRAVTALSGNRDVFTGLVCDGRPEEPGADRACGLFLNTVPFGVTGRPRRWRELVREVLAAEIALLPRRRYPLAALQEERGGRDPLVRTLFTFVDLRAAPVRFELHLPQTRFPLD
ncbi:MAG TPA: condensation domain-containing protein, partial [Candidatus Dormibacteraeota bacterium]|nr:condensation domain-containing protein [Candidatus Dormibacteraeota bacterium]